MEPETSKIQTQTEAQTRNIWPMLGGLMIGLGALGLLGMLITSLSSVLWAAALGIMALVIYNVYRADHSKWWALIPAYAMGAVAGSLAIETAHIVFQNDTVGLLQGSYWMAVMAAPFGYVYYRNRANWWALIPGGFFAFGAAGFMLGAMWPVVPAAMIVGGVYMLAKQMNSKHETQQQPALRQSEAVPQLPQQTTSFTPLRVPQQQVPVSGPDADRPRP